MAEVDDVPIGQRAVIGRILAHWRDDNAVGKGEVSDHGRREKLRHSTKLRQCIDSQNLRQLAISAVRRVIDIDRHPGAAALA